MAEGNVLSLSTTGERGGGKGTPSPTTGPMSFLGGTPVSCPMSLAGGYPISGPMPLLGGTPVPGRGVIQSQAGGTPVPGREYPSPGGVPLARTGLGYPLARTGPTHHQDRTRVTPAPSGQDWCNPPSPDMLHLGRLWHGHYSYSSFPQEDRLVFSLSLMCCCHRCKIGWKLAKQNRLWIRKFRSSYAINSLVVAREDEPVTSSLINFTLAS